MDSSIGLVVSRPTTYGERHAGLAGAFEEPGRLSITNTVCLAPQELAFNRRLRKEI